MRNTRQRSLVLDIINNSYNHPTAYMVYDKCIKLIPNISLGTVYRNLNTLVDLGEIQRLDIPGGMTRYDKAVCHNHFICLKCKGVYDLKGSLNFDEEIEGNKVYTCKVSYEGICCDCLKKNEGDDNNGIKRK